MRAVAGRPSGCGGPRTSSTPGSWNRCAWPIWRASSRCTPRTWRERSEGSSAPRSADTSEGYGWTGQRRSWSGRIRRWRRSRWRRGSRIRVTSPGSFDDTLGSPPERTGGAGGTEGGLRPHGCSLHWSDVDSARDPPFRPRGPPARPRVEEGGRDQNDGSRHHRQSPGVRSRLCERNPDQRVAHDRKRRPLPGRGAMADRVEFGRPERVADREAFGERLIEPLNERDGAPIGDTPLAGDDAARSGLDQWRSQALNSFTLYHEPTGRPTPGQH